MAGITRHHRQTRISLWFTALHPFNKGNEHIALAIQRNTDKRARWRKMVEVWFSSLGENRDRVSFEEVQIHEGEGGGGELLRTFWGDSPFRRRASIPVQPPYLVSPEKGRPMEDPSPAYLFPHRWEKHETINGTIILTSDYRQDWRRLL